MNSASPENSTISSKRRGDVASRDMPRIAALRKTLSRPDSSGWKPAPSSSSADIRLCTLTVPGVRLEDAGHALQQRRLARAVLADDAEHLAFLHVERDVLRAR